MRVIQMTATAGPDGVLRLEVPAVGAGAECEVVVQVRPAAAPEGRGWPPGYLESVVGSIHDESFVAPPRHPPRPVEALD